MAEAEQDRVQQVIDELRLSGAVTGYRLAECNDLSGEDLRRLAKRSVDDKKLQGAAFNALRLRSKSRQPAPPPPAESEAPLGRVSYWAAEPQDDAA